MFWGGKSIEDVANMVGRLLRIARITCEEAHHLDHVLKHKVRMPQDWDPDEGSILARLEAGEIDWKPLEAIEQE
jgi:hypothetical protein